MINIIFHSYNNINKSSYETKVVSLFDKHFCLYAYFYIIMFLQDRRRRKVEDNSNIKR